MKPATAHNFHLPLSDELYRQLRDQARRAKRPATAMARDAIAAWLKDRERASVGQGIAAYAARAAGSEADLDPVLEAASIEHLLGPAKPRRQKPRKR